MDGLPAGLHGAHLIADLRRDIGHMRMRTLLAERQLVHVGKKVVVEHDRQLALNTRAAAALLLGGPRAALTRHTAMLVHGCPAADGGEIHVLVDYHRKRPEVSGVVVHQGLFDEQDVVLRDGLRVMAIEYALTEMLCDASRPVALACADQALALTPPAERAEFRAELLHRIGTRRDSRGTRRSRVLLNLATGLSESPAESWLLLAMFDAGIGVPRQQVPVLDVNGRVIYRLDFAWEEARVAVEYDDYAAHVDRLVRDAARDEDLRRRGWTVIHADVDDLRDPTRLHTEIRRAFRRRRFAA